MDYIEVNLKIMSQKDVFTEIFIAELSSLGYDSFTETETGLLAYIPAAEFSEEALQKHLSIQYPQVNYIAEIKEVIDQNWNVLWEQNYFNPILIDEECVIRSQFHENYPKAKYEIIINPKMSFGTGHHETTRLMVRQVLKLELKDKKLLDMGCGTGILAILAAKRGAAGVTGADFDKWAYDNSCENIKVNNVPEVEIIFGTVDELKNRKFDIVLANINRNVLLADFTKFATLLTSKGQLIISGFYVEDINDFQYIAENNYLQMVHKDNINSWAVVVFQKIN